MTKKPRLPKDPNKLAKSIADIATGNILPKKEKNPAAVALGKLGGLKGGNARNAKLTPERKKEIAVLAAQARWKKSDP